MNVIRGDYMRVLILIMIIGFFLNATTSLVRQNGVNQNAILDIRQGWNLISMPGYKAYRASLFFNMINTKSILGYDKYVNQWISYHSKDTNRFNQLIMSPGVGYWLFAHEDFKVGVTTSYNASVIHISDDEKAKEVSSSVIIRGVKWKKAVFRNVDYVEASKSCQGIAGRLPTMQELYVYYQAIHIEDRFKGSDVYYWTLGTRYDTSWTLNFKTGKRKLIKKFTPISARCLLY